ncbi:hypothetical protein HK105_202122 [Polyrhizophydium stewartii]|uniref:C1q domain-containing protein n=1 Tax=Polyrhizophydium stewartii TaxID=2732419 RepID=A0ABR4NFD6_9FUNG
MFAAETPTPRLLLTTDDQGELERFMSQQANTHVQPRIAHFGSVVGSHSSLAAPQQRVAANTPDLSHRRSGIPLRAASSRPPSTPSSRAASRPVSRVASRAASRQGSLAALGPAANELSRSLQAVMDSQTNATESAHARRRSLTADPNGPRFSHAPAGRPRTPAETPRVAASLEPSARLTATAPSRLRNYVSAAESASSVSASAVSIAETWAGPPRGSSGRSTDNLSPVRASRSQTTLSPGGDPPKTTRTRSASIAGISPAAASLLPSPSPRSSRLSLLSSRSLHPAKPSHPDRHAHALARSDLPRTVSSTLMLGPSRETLVSTSKLNSGVPNARATSTASLEIHQVILALQDHDRTIRSLQTALADLDTFRLSTATNDGRPSGASNTTVSPTLALELQVTHISDRVARLETEFGSWRQKIDAQMLEHEHFMGMLPIVASAPPGSSDTSRAVDDKAASGSHPAPAASRSRSASIAKNASLSPAPSSHSLVVPSAEKPGSDTAAPTTRRSSTTVSDLLKSVDEQKSANAALERRLLALEEMLLSGAAGSGDRGTHAGTAAKLMQQPGVIERFDALERSVRAMLRRIDGVESDTNDDDDDLGSPTRDSVDTDLSKTSRVTRQPRISVSAAQGDVISDEMSEQDFCRRMEMLEKLVSDINRRAKNILEAHNRGLADHATPAGVKHSSSFGQTPQAMAHNAKALDELIEDIRERSQTLASRSDKSCATAQHSGGLEKQLSAIQAQMAALSRRLDSLDDGRSHLRAPSALSASAAFGSSFGLQASGTSTPATQKKGSPAPDIGAAAAQSLANHRRRSTIASSEFQPTSDSKHGEPSQFETQWPVPTAHPSAAAVATREDLRKLHKRLAEKVDTAVLEELVRHIATRDELKSAVDKRAHLAWVEKLIERRTKSMRKEISGLTAKQESRDSEPQHDFDQRARGVVDAEIQKHVEAVSHEMDLKLAALRREFHLEASLAQGREGAAKHARHRSEGGQDSVAALESRLKSEFKAWIRKHVASQMDESWLAADERHKALYEQIEQTVQERVSTLWREHTQMLDDHREEFETVQTVARRLTREFDEKLYLLCSDLSACKTLFAKQVSQPFYRCGQWLWRSGTLKMGSGVPWNMQSVNTGGGWNLRGWLQQLRVDRPSFYKNAAAPLADPDNFKWDQDHINLRVSEAGLYEITLAIFTKSKPSIQLVVNGESVLSAINSPSYIVHHSSGFVVDGDGRVEPGTVTGISLVDFLALPSKTTLSIHYHGVRKQASLGHGFVGLRRL